MKRNIPTPLEALQGYAKDKPPTPDDNVHTAVEYIATTYGEDMTYWEHTDEHPAALPVHEREAWHRDAWDREQDALSAVIKQTRRQTERAVFDASMRHGE